MTVHAEAALDMSLDDVIVAASRTPKGKGKSKGKAIEKAGSEKATEPDASAALLDLSLEEVIAASSKGGGGRKGGKGQGYDLSGKANDKGDGRDWGGANVKITKGGKGRSGGSWKGGKDRWEGGGSSKGDWEDWKGGKADKWRPSKDGGAHEEGWVSKKTDSWGSAKQADSWKDWKSEKNEKWGGGTSKQDGWEDWKPMKAAGEGRGTWIRDRDGGKDSWGKPATHNDGWTAQDSKPDTWGKSARDRDRDRDRERNDEWIGRPARGHTGAGGNAGKWWGGEREEAPRASGRDRYMDRYEAQSLRTEASHDRYSGRGGGAGRGPPGGDGWPSGGQKRARHEEDDNDRDRRSKLIKVTNIPLDLDWKDIKEAFEAETGKIERCDLRGGTALIKFTRVEDAYRAAETFDRGELNGKIISVTVEH